ncbi:hypothetical protein OXX59_002861 [Metschnikowia pulcherrima]
MGPKKASGSVKPRSKKATSKSGPESVKIGEEMENLEKPKRGRKKGTKSAENAEQPRQKRAYKPREKKQSLILSLQSSPHIKEQSTKAQKVPLLQRIPDLTPGSRHATGKPGSGTFTEPELAEPKPGFSGHPLETFPPEKVKRAAVSLGRGRKARSAQARTPESGASEEEIAEKEKAYQKSLQTAESEHLTGDSSVRADVGKITKKRGRPRSSGESTTIEIPPTPKSDLKVHGSPGFSVKRIKIISPKRSNALLGNSAPPPVEDSSDANENDDFCSACGGTGVFICCDSCPKSFHLLCCNPPMRDVPEDNWNCNSCNARTGASPRKVWHDLGMFGPLVNSSHGRDPTEFRLPKRLRDNTFIGVSTGDNHAYSDTSVKPELSYSKANGAQISGYNKDEALDIDDLYDKDGVPYLCHKCGLSGLQHRALAFCDYCPLQWHLDCLPYPMCSAKTKGQKWRCPGHVEALIPSLWSERRSFKDALVLDAAAHNNFLRFAQANNFVVKYSEQPYLEKNMLLQEYEQFQTRSFLSSGTELTDSLKEPEDSDDDTDSGAKVTPSYLQNVCVGDRIVAKTSAQSTKLLLMTNADDPEQRPFVYRVPEQQLLLDFSARVKSERRGILQGIQEYEELITVDKKKDLDAVQALLTFHDRANPTAGKGSQNGTSANSEDFSKPSIEASADESIPRAELDELRAIRRQIQAKGKDALLHFLAS